MPKPRPDTFMRHEPVEVVKRRPITQRNLTSPVVNPPVDADDDTFGSRQSVIQEVLKVAKRHGPAPKRDRTPKGVNDGRGKRSVADVLLSHPLPESRAVYALQRIASLEDQIGKILDLCDKETLEIIFKRRESLKHYRDD